MYLFCLYATLQILLFLYCFCTHYGQDIVMIYILWHSCTNGLSDSASLVEIGSVLEATLTYERTKKIRCPSWIRCRVSEILYKCDASRAQKGTLPIHILRDYCTINISYIFTTFKL
jgi:hypothetical protein